MTIIIGEVTPVINTGIRKVCKKPYAGHPNGCPNWNKEGRFDCPPKAPPLHRVINLEKTVFAVVSAFDIGSHVLRMKEKHPGWTDRQLRNVLYWQGSARKKLRGGIAQLLSEHPELVVLTCPEACGLMVTKTVEPLNITMSWPPMKTVHHIALAGTPAPALRERYPNYCEAKTVIFGGMAMCNTMHDNWQDYYRISNRAQTFEAKPARGGEEVGDEFRKKIAKKGEWICRNPRTGYTWSMKEKDFYKFYAPFDRKYLPEKKAKPKKNKGRASASTETKNDTEAGPLFD